MPCRAGRARSRAADRGPLSGQGASEPGARGELPGPREAPHRCRRRRGGDCMPVEDGGRDGAVRGILGAGGGPAPVGIGSDRGMSMRGVLSSLMHAGRWWGGRAGRSSRVLVGCALAVGLSVGGCTPTPAPTPTDSGTGPVTATVTSATSSASASTSGTSPAATDPGIPAAARVNTIDGAEAFVRYFIDTMNGAYVSSRSEALRRLTSPDCPGCTAILADIDAQQRMGLHSAGDVSRLISAFGVLPETGLAKVEARTEQLPTPIVDADGRTVDTNRATPSNLLFTLAWSDSWSVIRLQVI